MRYFLFIVFFLISIIATTMELFADDLKDSNITIVTAEYPPFNFTEDNKLKGISTEIVMEVLKEMNLENEIQIKVYPWTRTYRTALNRPNTFIFSLGRIKEREELFKWVGKIVTFESCVWKAKSNKKIKVTKLSDLKKYRIGAQRDEYIEQYLKKNGYANNIEDTTQPIAAIKKLLADRTDVFVFNKYSTIYILKKEGINSDDLEIVYIIKELNVHAYLACSKKTPDFIVEKFRAALDKVKKDGRHARILKKWYK